MVSDNWRANEGCCHVVMMKMIWMTPVLAIGILFYDIKIHWSQFEAQGSCIHPSLGP